MTLQFIYEKNRVHRGYLLEIQYFYSTFRN